MRRLYVACAAALVVLGLMAGVASAARSGGTFNFVLPYGGDVLTLDAHKTPNTNDQIVTININRSLYSWDERRQPAEAGAGREGRRLGRRPDLQDRPAKRGQVPQRAPDDRG